MESSSTYYAQEDRLSVVFWRVCFVILLIRREWKITMGREYNWILYMRIISFTVLPLVQQTRVCTKFNIHWFLRSFSTGCVSLKLLNIRHCFRSKSMNYTTFVISLQVVCLWETFHWDVGVSLCLSHVGFTLTLVESLLKIQRPQHNCELQLRHRRRMTVDGKEKKTTRGSQTAKYSEKI